MAKSKIVLFLGAGSSKAFGLPLTNQIFPIIKAKLTDQSLFKNQEQQDSLDAFISKLFPGLGKLFTKDYPQITDILSLLDHLVNSGNSIWPRSETNEIHHHRQLFEKAIFEALTVSSNHSDWGDSEKRAELLEKFTNWIYQSLQSSYFTLVSTNYDILVEQALYTRLRSSFSLPGPRQNIDDVIDFGISWRDPGGDKVHPRPSNPQLSIFKLHGSTNWLKCDLCNHIYINTFGNIYQQAFKNTIDEDNTCDCGNAPLSTLIVAPSFERGAFDNNLLYIWNNTLESLRTADEWVIIGYSLPPEDLNIKSIFIRAYHGRTIKPKIKIVQKSEALKPRFESIFNDVEYISGGLEEFISLI